jgi:hypothetical protein
VASVALPQSKPVSYLDQARAKTNYAPRRFTGFIPLPLAASAEMRRLASGFAGLCLLQVIMEQTLGKRVKETEPFCETTDDLSTAYLAEAARCDERTLQRELLGMAQRGIISYVKGRKGLWRITPLFRKWDSLPDYKPGPMVEPELDQANEPEQPEGEREQTVTRLTEKPVLVRAGSSSRKIKVPCGISEFYCKSNLDIHFEAVVQGGSLCFSFIGPQFQAAGNDLLKAKGMQAKMRHGCRILHPRAVELSDLFDPLLLLNHGGRSLYGDFVCLKAACEAVGQVPHDYLVKLVIDRAARPIKSPKAAVAICKEIALNWERSKSLPPKKRDPRNVTQEDVERWRAEDKARIAAKRRQA